MAKKEKAFGSAKEVIKTYFPTEADKKATERREGYGSEAEVIVQKLAAEFGAGLKTGLRK